MPYTIGIDVGGTKTAYGLLDDSLRVVARRRTASDASLTPEAFFDDIARNVTEMLRESAIPASEFGGVGICVPSFVRAEDDYIIKTANLPLLKDFYARDYLEGKLNVRVAVGNDMHAASIAEHALGAGRRRENMLYCLLSTGIASGIIINGRLFRGSYGFSGESGHTIVTPNEGPMCGCGNQGCVSAYASAANLPQSLRKWIAEGAETTLTEPFSMPQIADAYRRGDALAVRAIEQMTTYLAVWLFNLYVTLNIKTFVFGGGLLNMELPLLELVRENFDALNKTDLPVEFLTTLLGEDFGILGASLFLSAEL